MPPDAAFERLTSTLRQALNAPTLEESRSLIAEALKRTEKLSKAVTTAAVKRGRLGGQKTAERGPEYFKQIAAMRKTRGGGRPKKQPEAPHS